jgi:ATP-dependent DNA ligase
MTQMCLDSPEADAADGMRLARLADTLQRVAAEPARLKATSIMSQLLEGVLRETPQELLPCVALATMQLEPASRPLKLGVGEGIVLQALETATGHPAKELKSALRTEGDVGEFTARLLAERPPWAERAASGSVGEEEEEAPLPLRVNEVHAALLAIAAQSGKGANGRRAELLAELLQRASPSEGTLIVRAVRGQLRSGLADKGMRDALAAAAAAVTEPEPEVVAAAIAAEAAAAQAEVARLAEQDAIAAEDAPGEDALAEDAPADAPEAPSEPSSLPAPSPAEAAAAKKDAAAAKKEAAAAKKHLSALGKARRVAEREAAKAAKAADTARAQSRRRAAALVSAAFAVQPCYHSLVDALSARGGVWRLGEVGGASAGTPVQTMGASAVASVEAAMERLGVGSAFLCEWKYDGERCQAHLLPPAPTGDPGGDGGSSRVRLFSRSLDEVSARFPEIVEALPRAFGAAASGTAEGEADGAADVGGVRSVIIDGEICAVDDETGAVLPFQSLASRPRKAPTAEQLEAGPSVCVFAFDLLELNGRSMLNLPLRERRRMLSQVLRPITHRVDMADGVEASTEAELRVELERAIDMQAEGLMVKLLGPADEGGAAADEGGAAADEGGAGREGDAAVKGGGAASQTTVYEAGKRSLHWLKLKRDYIDGLGDSFDLVPIGAYRGRGKRAGGFGAYLLACYDPVAKAYQPVCKLGTGFNDEELARLSAGSVEAPGGEADGRVQLGDSALPAALEPHAWLVPSVVWEVTAAEVSVSPTYNAASGLVEENKGLALRFPRLVRERPDKQPEQATTAEQLAQAYRSQHT